MVAFSILHGWDGSCPLGMYPTVFRGRGYASKIVIPGLKEETANGQGQ